MPTGGHVSRRDRQAGQHPFHRDQRGQDLEGRHLPGRSGRVRHAGAGCPRYGVTELEGGGLEHIVKQLGYGDDPLNQRASVGWKGMRAAERLVEQYMIRIESVSSYSANAAAN